MEFKHAPAPWMATKREFFIELYDDNGSYVGLTNSTANAHLIAAAPELLALLMKLDRIGGLGLSTHKEIQSVIAKALGQQ
ncbi:hypothetical protein [Providencia rettgeri]|uniref:hypothetical protein n=1 Tax=Providencia rettgeri TaxID=587 RepID=UPI002447947D|nr:hypothetical protein [Providencia rettgeri]MDH2365420.1 hypothetical protein [Providencia rettgeri]